MDEKGIPYKIILVKSEAGIYSDKVGMLIGLKYHYGIQIGDVVYDNLTTGGMKFDNWIEDLGLKLGISDIGWNYAEEITSNGR